MVFASSFSLLVFPLDIVTCRRGESDRLLKSLASTKDRDHGSYTFEPVLFGTKKYTPLLMSLKADLGEAKGIVGDERAIATRLDS